MAPPVAPQAELGPVPDPETELAQFLARLQRQIGGATRAAAVLPSGSDLAFHTALDSSLARRADEEAHRVMQTADRVLEWVSNAAFTPGPRGQSTGLRPQPLAEPRQLSADEFAATMGDVMDHLLERTDVLLDEYAGKSPNQTRGMDERSKKSAATSMRDKNMPLPQHVLRAPIEPRPQEAFIETKPDNRPNVPWSRAFRFDRPHSRQKPQEWDAPPPLDPEGNPIPQGRRMGTYVEEDDARKNPYYYEILSFEPPKHAFIMPKLDGQEEEDAPTTSTDGYEVPTLSEPVPLNLDNPAGESGVPLTWVSDKAGLEALLAHLLEPRVKEIAIDLEHHSLRSFQGLTSLMQLSTRWGDYIIDPLQEEVRINAEILNQVLTDPAKVKVLHGADADVLWLQRDLGLYLVGLFDTFHAARVLNFSQRGLAYLLSRYTGFEADKRFQLADWRIRPLPGEMLFYARSDTHSLLYVYDRLRAELASSKGYDAIRTVFKRSKSVAFKVYAKAEWASDGTGSDGWAGIYRRYLHQSTKSLASSPVEQDIVKQAHLVWTLFKDMLVLRELHHLRDNISREVDESNHYTIASRSLLQLVRAAPTSRPAVAGALSGKLTPLIRTRQAEIASVIQGALSSFNKLVEKATAQEKPLSSEILIEQVESVRSELDLPESLTTDMLRAARIQEGSIPTHPLAQPLPEESRGVDQDASSLSLAASNAENQLKRLITDGPRVNAALFTPAAGPQTEYSALFARQAPHPQASTQQKPPTKSLFELPPDAFDAPSDAIVEDEDIQDTNLEEYRSIFEDFAQAVAPLLSNPNVSVDAGPAEPKLDSESVAFTPAGQRGSAMAGLEASSTTAPPDPAPAPAPIKQEESDVEMLDDETKLHQALERDSVQVRKGPKRKLPQKSIAEPKRDETAKHDFSHEVSLLDQKPTKQKRSMADKGKKTKDRGQSSKARSSTSKTPKAAKPARKPKEFGSKSATFNH